MFIKCTYLQEGVEEEEEEEEKEEEEKKEEEEEAEKEEEEEEAEEEEAEDEEEEEKEKEEEEKDNSFSMPFSLLFGASIYSENALALRSLLSPRVSLPRRCKNARVRREHGERERSGRLSLFFFLLSLLSHQGRR